MFTERQQNILGVLRQHRDGITSDEIARLVGVSSKTVRTDISPFDGHRRYSCVHASWI